MNKKRVICQQSVQISLLTGYVVSRLICYAIVVCPYTLVQAGRYQLAYTIIRTVPEINTQYRLVGTYLSLWFLSSFVYGVRAVFGIVGQSLFSTPHYTHPGMQTNTVCFSWVLRCSPALSHKSQAGKVREDGQQFYSCDERDHVRQKYQP